MVDLRQDEFFGTRINLAKCGNCQDSQVEHSWPLVRLEGLELGVGG